MTTSYRVQIIGYGEVCETDSVESAKEEANHLIKKGYRVIIKRVIVEDITTAVLEGGPLVGGTE